MLPSFTPIEIPPAFPDHTQLPESDSTFVFAKRAVGSQNFVQRGTELYEIQIRSQVETDHHGQIIAIDIETGAFEIAKNTMLASDRLLEQYPDAQIWCIRIGYPAVHRFGVKVLH